MNRIRRSHFGVLTVMSILLALSETVSVSGDKPRTPPGFSLDRLDGGAFNLQEDLGNSVILLEFWGMCCHAKLSDLKTIDDLYLQYGNRGLKVYGINIDDASRRSQVKPAVKKYGYTFPVLLDPTQEVLRKFSPDREKPYTVVIDRKGDIIHESGGDQSKSRPLLEKIIEECLEQERLSEHK